MVEDNPWNPSDFPYPVDYNDCFETPLQAYQDVQPLIDWLAAAAGPASASREGDDESGVKPAHDAAGGHQPGSICLYDPYYCNGRTALLLREHLGYTNVIHEKRDFYADIRHQTVPPHEILITNPPYSDTHKTKCLDFCFQRLRSSARTPFLLLMPAYTASKQYFRNFLLQNGVKHDADEDEVVYIIPGQEYQYDHPENTGKEESPFASLWFCGIGRDRVQALRTFLSSNGAGGWPCRVAFSLADLNAQNVVSLQNRPNPRQRRKRRLKSVPEARKEPKSGGDCGEEVSTGRSSSAISLEHNISHTNKKSKYRNPSGKRTKKRF